MLRKCLRDATTRVVDGPRFTGVTGVHGPRFFSENFGGRGLVDRGFLRSRDWWTPVWWTPVLVDPGLLGWIPVSVNDLAVLNRPKYKGI